MRILKLWRLRRKRRELKELLLRDRELRSEPGETAEYLPNRMLAIGHEIAVLRFEIDSLEEALS